MAAPFRGLWWSGLRLGEALNLYWDRPDKLCVDLTGSRPMLRIVAELEKGGRDRLLPIAPELPTSCYRPRKPSGTGGCSSPEGRRVAFWSAVSAEPSAGSARPPASKWRRTPGRGRSSMLLPTTCADRSGAVGPAHAPGAHGPDAHENIETTSGTTSAATRTPRLTRCGRHTTEAERYCFGYCCPKRPWQRRCGN